MKKQRFRRRSRPVRLAKRSGRHSRPFRRARIESLEPRLVLAAPTLAAIGDATLLAGAPLHIALNGFDADGDALTYTVSSSNPN